MPVTFECVLKCDAPGCGRNQAGRADLATLNIPTLAAQGSTSAAEPFALSYDRTSGLRWTVSEGKAACSDACRRALLEVAARLEAATHEVSEALREFETETP